MLTDTARYQNLSKHSSAGLGFDAVWSIAVGLHNASEKVKINDSSGCDHLPGELVPLEEFSYRNQRMGCVLQKSIAETNIAGVTVSDSTIVYMCIVVPWLVIMYGFVHLRVEPEDACT